MQRKNNGGIVAGGGANVVGNAVASGENSKAEVHHVSVGAEGDDGRPRSPQEIGELLAQLIEQLRESDHPERDDLVEAAQDAREELASESPRRGKLKFFARSLVDAVPRFTALASLAVTIEQAIHGL
ncbi:hypothetical protein ACFC0M_01920 [Streptomyces sp. NPDC056149]|uniref:hypothetical protein n=1 Tax=unclassified Streptomyces TaxID=2593676 RepID=UPI0023815636|nr:hypothetical protein [Streptomyces sp. WZ-12]